MVTPNELFSLEGKVALVTGGSRGLGRQMVLAFAAAGADVAIVSRKIETCEEVAEEVRAMGRKAFPYACHVGRWDQVGEMAQAVHDHFGKIDILVNNAGMSPQYDTLLDVSEQMYDSVMNLNLKGVFRLSAVVGDMMVKDGGGSIINVSSIASIMPSVVEIPYAAAKAGINNLTVGLSKYYGPTVRVNAIMPGPFLTDVAKAWDIDAMTKRIEGISSLKRLGNPDEGVGAALYYASNASSYTTGTVLTIDGGCTS